MKGEKELIELREGNLRFVRGETKYKPPSGKGRIETYSRKKLKAVVLCCSDSRVPPEKIFDVSMGDLFVIRVAGAVLDTITLATIELAVSAMNPSLIVIMGHEACKAVELAVKGTFTGGSINMITSHFAMSIAQTRGSSEEDEKLFSDNVTRHYSIITAISLPQRSLIISDAVSRGKLLIVPAFYDIDTGEVEFLNHDVK